MKILLAHILFLSVLNSTFAAKATGSIDFKVDHIESGKASLKVSLNPKTSIDKLIMEEIGCFDLMISSFDLKESIGGPIYKTFNSCNLEGTLEDGWILRNIAPLSGKTKKYDLSVSSTSGDHSFYEKVETTMDTNTLREKLKRKRNAEKSIDFEARKLGFVVDQHSRNTEGFGFAGHLISLSAAGDVLSDVESIIIEDTNYVSISNFESDTLKDFRRDGDLAVAGKSFDSEKQIGLFTSQGLNVKHEYVYAPDLIAGFSQIFGGTGITGSKAKVKDDSLKNGPATIKLFVIYNDDTYSETTLNFRSSELNKSEMKDLVRSLRRL